MPERNKVLEGMKRNPSGWKTKACQRVAKFYGITWEKLNTNVFFYFPGGVKYSIPVHLTIKTPPAEIKPNYIKGFVALMEKHIESKV